jgi:hypothetical protein
MKMDLKETGWVGMEWILMAQDRGKWQVAVTTVTDILVS